MLLKKDVIKQTRLDKGWTQGQLAELCDLSVRTIQRTEKSGVASMETSLAIASVFEINVDELYVKEGIVEDVSEIPAKITYIGFVVMFLIGLLIGKIW